MRIENLKRQLAVLSLIVILLSNSTLRAQAQDTFSETSWASGIVVPEGAQLADGSKVQWEDVENVTAITVLPNISQPDNIVYAVLSLMTASGSVMQVAAGIFPGESSWSVYSWLFTDLTSNPVKYQWILNASGPSMSPNDAVSISIFKSQLGAWSLSVVDLNTNSSVVQTFSSDLAPSLMIGEQEVFGLESYSRSSATFEEMGNLTLEDLFINGSDLSGGEYAFDGNWNPSVNPLFAIGTIGAVPPIFISLENGANNSIVWTYANFWENDQVSNGWIETILLPALLISSMIVLTCVVVATRKRRSITGS